MLWMCSILFQECWYSNVVYLGKEHDIPILTMTYASKISVFIFSFIFLFSFLSLVLSCRFTCEIITSSENSIPLVVFHLIICRCTKSEMDGYKSGELPLCAPAKNYVNTIARGLVEGKQLTQGAAMAYLQEASVKPLG